MPKKGQGKLARDLPGLGADQIDAVIAWLAQRAAQLDYGARRTKEAARLNNAPFALANHHYYRDAARGVRWAASQLRHVGRARRHQEEVTGSASRTDAGGRQ